MRWSDVGYVWWELNSFLVKEYIPCSVFVGAVILIGMLCAFWEADKDFHKGV